MTETNSPREIDISVIIINWNTCELLADCLMSVDAHLANDPNLSSEIIVVDNGSEDGSQEMIVTEFPQVKLHCNEVNEGFARANNQGIRVSSGRYVLLLNSDARLVPEAAQRMVGALDADASLGIVGVCLAFPDGRPQFCHGSYPNLWTEFRSLFGFHKWDLSCWNELEQPLPVDWVSGACLMVRTETLSEIGLLDERFFFFGEEVDLCLRSSRAGWKVALVPSDPVVHLRAGSTGKTSRRIMRLYRGKAMYGRLHFAIPQQAALICMIWISSMAKMILFLGLSLIDERYAQRRKLWLEVVQSLIIEGFTG